MTDVLVEQLQALLPPLSYDPKGPVLGAQLAAEAGALSEAIAALEAVESAIFPATAGEFIADWERNYGITPAPGATQDDRVKTVLAAMADLGGQSIPYFVRLAALFGVVAGAENFTVPTVGSVSVGDFCYSGDWPDTWRLNAPLSAYVAPAMEARIAERRPANTSVVFGYGNEVTQAIFSAADTLFDAVNYILPSKLKTNHD